MLECYEFEYSWFDNILFDFTHIEVVIAFDVVVPDSQEAVNDLLGFARLCDEDEVLGWCHEY